MHSAAAQVVAHRPRLAMAPLAVHMPRCCLMVPAGPAGATDFGTTTLWHNHMATRYLLSESDWSDKIVMQLCLDLARSSSNPGSGRSPNARLQHARLALLCWQGACSYTPPKCANVWRFSPPLKGAFTRVGSILQFLPPSQPQVSAAGLPQGCGRLGVQQQLQP